MKFHYSLSQLLVVLLFFINHSQSQSLSSNDYHCAQNLSYKLGFVYGIAVNQTGFYNYCSRLYGPNNSTSLSIACSNNKVTSLFFLGDEKSKLIKPSDLICFFSLTSLRYENYPMNLELFYYSFQTVKTYYYGYRYDNTFFNEINQTLPSAYSFEIRSNQLKSSTLKISYLKNIDYFYLTTDYFIGIYLDGEKPLDEPNNLITLYVEGALNLPNLQNYSKPLFISLDFVSDYNESSLINFNLLPKNIRYTAFHKSTKNIPFYIENNENMETIINVNAGFEKPSNGFIDLRNNRYTEILILKVGDDFNINGEIPLLIRNGTSLRMGNGNFTIFPDLSLNNYNGSTLSLSFCNLDIKLPKYNGDLKSLTLTGNNLHGSVDNSYCKLQPNEITLTNNKLSGEIPSCFSCYLDDPNVEFRFRGNQFSNFEMKTRNCTSFVPIVTLNKDSTLTFNGTDIGIPTYWQLNGTSFSYHSGKSKIDGSYIVKFYDINVTALEYFSIYFEFPLPSRTLTFPNNLLSIKPPIVTNVFINGNQIIIYGSHFSSYLGFKNQIVFLKDNEICDIISISFFEIVCATIKNYFGINKLTIQTGELKRNLFINFTKGGPLNNKTCPNICQSDTEYFACELASGQCINLTVSPTPTQTPNITISPTPTQTPTSSPNVTTPKIICEKSISGIVINSTEPIECTIIGSGDCTTFSGSSCSTLNESSSVVCLTKSKSIKCNGNIIICNSSFLKCSINISNRGLNINDNETNLNIFDSSDSQEL